MAAQGIRPSGRHLYVIGGPGGSFFQYNRFYNDDLIQCLNFLWVWPEKV